ncbi:hypothetical protein ACLB2K_004301 [Fragaria x ananassa]
MSIIEKDFDRLMGLRCRSTEVNIHCLTAKCEAAEWKKRLCGNDTYINMKSLKKTVVYTDDDELFMVSFALFALPIMFYPSTPGFVDPRFLISLRNPRAIRSHNWEELAVVEDGLRLDIADLRRAMTSLHKPVVKREAEPLNSVVKEAHRDSVMESQDIIELDRKECPRKVGYFFVSVVVQFSL